MTTGARMPERQIPPALAGRFAANVRRLRERAGLSQEELSYRAGIHRTQISLIEGGHRVGRLDTVIKLAGALGVGVEELADGMSWEPAECSAGGFKVSGAEDEADG
jgi:transcriptional regulator with XRE-family HTH domain